MLLFWILRVGLINIIVNQINGYVLFAANLDDFRSIAKKFIPEKLADQLAAMASESSAKYKQKAVERDEQYDEYESEGDVTTTITETPKTTAKKRYAIKNPVPEVNIDELVEKVREKLLQGNKPKKDRPKQRYVEKAVDGSEKQVPYDDGNAQYSYEGENGEKQPNANYEDATERNLPKSKAKIEKVDRKHKEKDYHENVNAEPTNDKQGMIFHEFDLRNTNDSYEDYPLPEKDKFASDETTDNKQKALRQEYTPKHKETLKDYDDLKARTESLWYDEEVRHNRTKGGAVRNLKATRKGKGTMIPTLEYYKMTTPDYYKKLPVIAEKYDFNEPIPERDREPENLKPIGNPPARINKKIRV